MEYIGSIPIKIWLLAQEIARKESYPIEQPPNCPYVILLHISDSQLLTLTGSHKRQHIDLFITDVYPPKDHDNYIRTSGTTQAEAERQSWELISKALTSFLHT